MTDAQRSAARSAVTQQVLRFVAGLDLSSGSVIAAYEPLRTEPAAPELLSVLAEAGHRVLVPITLADRDLDWHQLSDPAPLGRAAISSASVVLVPAFAVDSFGHRLGRGGGSYDRALSRVTPGTRVVALLFNEEVVAEVPTEPWDRPVHYAITPEGRFDLGASGRGNR